jgi:hypothetical protein
MEKSLPQQATATNVRSQDSVGAKDIVL